MIGGGRRGMPMRIARSLSDLAPGGDRAVRSGAGQGRAAPGPCVERRWALDDRRACTRRRGRTAKPKEAWARAWWIGYRRVN